MVLREQTRTIGGLRWAIGPPPGTATASRFRRGDAAPPRGCWPLQRIHGAIPAPSSGRWNGYQSVITLYASRLDAQGENPGARQSRIPRTRLTVTYRTNRPGPSEAAGTPSGSVLPCSGSRAAPPTGQGRRFDPHHRSSQLPSPPRRVPRPAARIGLPFGARRRAHRGHPSGKHARRRGDGAAPAAGALHGGATRRSAWSSGPPRMPPTSATSSTCSGSTPGASEPDVLQLDVIWTPEFAAAGWILAARPVPPDTDDFFPAAIAANSLAGPALRAALVRRRRHALLAHRPGGARRPPRSRSCRSGSRACPVRAGPPLRPGLAGRALRGAGHGVPRVPRRRSAARILDGGRVRGRLARPRVAALDVDARRDLPATASSPAPRSPGRRSRPASPSRTARRRSCATGPTPYALMQDSAQSRVAGRFAVAPMPAAPGGRPTAALGGAQLAINAHSDHPDAAWALIEYPARSPAQMLERARVVGQFPTRPALYDEPELARALADPARRTRAQIIERAVPRPVTPVYTELSEILQIHLHRALTGSRARAALGSAAREMRALLDDAGAVPSATQAVDQATGGRCRAWRAGERRARRAREARLAGRWSRRRWARSCWSRCFRSPGPSGSRCTCTTCACRGCGRPFVGLANYARGARGPRGSGARSGTRALFAVAQRQPRARGWASRSRWR